MGKSRPSPKGLFLLHPIQPGRLLIFTTALFMMLLTACSSEHESPASFDVDALRTAQQELLSRYDLKPYDASRDPLPRAASFDEMFEPIGLFEFSDSLLFSELTNVKLNARGELIAADMQANQGYIFRPDGSLKKVLDPTECSPDFSGTARLIEFGPQESITVMYMGSPYSFAFDPNGECVGPVDHGGWNPMSITLLENRLFGFDIRRGAWSVWEMADSTKHVIHTATEFARMNSGYISVTGDMFVLNDTTLGLLFRHSPDVWRVSLTDSTVSTMGQTPPDFVETTEDIPPNVTSEEQINEARSRIWEGKSRTWGYYRLAEDLLIVYHINRSGEPFVSSTNSLGLRVMDLNGRTVHDAPITMKGYMTRFVAARDGLFFRLLNEYWDEEERLHRNPPVLVYRFVPPYPTS